MGERQFREGGEGRDGLMVLAKAKAAVGVAHLKESVLAAVGVLGQNTSVSKIQRLLSQASPGREGLEAHDAGWHLLVSAIAEDLRSERKLCKTETKRRGLYSLAVKRMSRNHPHRSENNKRSSALCACRSSSYSSISNSSCSSECEEEEECIASGRQTQRKREDGWRVGESSDGQLSALESRLRTREREVCTRSIRARERTHMHTNFFSLPIGFLTTETVIFPDKIS